MLFFKSILRTQFHEKHVLKCISIKKLFCSHYFFAIKLLYVVVAFLISIIALFSYSKLLTGPKEETVEDFWRMVWEYSIPTIVMLTRAFEGRVRYMYKNLLNVGIKLLFTVLCLAS